MANMKTTLIALGTLSASLFSFTTEHETAPKKATRSELAEEIVASLQLQSAQRYSALLPSVEELLQQMNTHADFYGANLEAAKADFLKTYQQEVLSELASSFNQVLVEGTKRGIDWSQAKLLRIENHDASKSKVYVAPLVLVLKVDNQEVRVRIEKVLFLNGEWHVSQFVALV